MKKIISGLWIILIMIMLTACADNRNAENVEKHETVEETGYTGMFYNEEELLIVRENGTMTVIAIAENKFLEGTYSKENDKFCFTIQNSDFEEIYGTYENSKWMINDSTYSRTYETGDYYNEQNGAGIVINSDGTFAIYEDFENKKGKLIGTYERVGCEWLFTSPIWEGENVSGSYDGRVWSLEGEVYVKSRGVNLSSISFDPLFQFYVKGENIFILGEKVSELRKSGFTINMDIDSINVMSGKLIEMSIIYDEAIAEIKVINPYENDVLLSECIVCSFFTEDTTGVYTINEEACGVENRDTLLDYDVYEYTKNKLVYKEHLMLPVNINTDFSKGEQIIDVTGNADVTYNFEGMILKSFKIELTDTIYDGLDTNADSTILSQLEPAEFQGILQVRNTIADSLRTAFADAGIQVQINEKTGEITMSNDILFDTDSYELSEEGQKYVEQFMKVYLSVLMSEQFVDYVEEVKLEGHADSSGSFGYNQSLSQKRAEAVKNYCLNNLAEDFTENEKEKLSQIVTARGYSSTDLVYDKDGNEDASASRRVAIKFRIDVEAIK